MGHATARRAATSPPAHTARYRYSRAGAVHGTYMSSTSYNTVLPIGGAKGMAVGSQKELSSFWAGKRRCCVMLAALCFSSDVGLLRARCTTRLSALMLVVASAPPSRPLAPYAAAAAPSGLGAAPAARPPFSINTPHRRFSGFSSHVPLPASLYVVRSRRLISGRKDHLQTTHAQKCGPVSDEHRGKAVCSA